ASPAPRVIFTPSGLASPALLHWRWAEGAQRWQWQREAGLYITVVP
ncbi:type II secretion system protein GspH, partial [Pseudomonas sp. MAFF212428]|nr:type II secretion system protein GspH [Pseudomonas brassicae]